MRNSMRSSPAHQERAQCSLLDLRFAAGLEPESAFFTIAESAAYSLQPTACFRPPTSKQPAKLTMPAPSKALIVIMSVVFAMSSSAISVASPAEGSQLPAGVSDLIAATPTMLSPASNQDQDKPKSKTTLRTGNTVTVTGSDIVFGGSDKPTLVDTVMSMIRNSETSTLGDDLLTQSVMIVLNAEGSEHESVVKKQLEAALECRDHEAMLRTCVEALVDIATFDEKHKELMDLAADTSDETEDATDEQIAEEGDA